MKNWNKKGDVGFEGRQILFDSFNEIKDILERTSFGTLKPYRVDGEILLIPAREYIKYLRSKNLPCPNKIEKFWPESGWEICWFEGEWV